MQLQLDSSILLRAKAQSEKEGMALLHTIEAISALPTAQVVQACANHTGLRAIPYEQLTAYQPDLDQLSYAECLKHQCILFETGETPLLVCANPFDEALKTWAAYRIDGYFEIAFVHPASMQLLMRRLEARSQAIAQLIGLEGSQKNPAEQGRPDEISPESIAQDDSQVIRLVNSTLYDAHRQGASDVHFENHTSGLGIKYRIDGALVIVRTLADPKLAEQVVSRLKVMAALDIGESRIPQDGRFSINIEARTVDLRLSIMPGLFGEDAVLRILDKRSLALDASGLTLERLGFDDSVKQGVRKLATQPYGMLLVTGPTGSGKTTSLYATLMETIRSDEKVITIEDPVEYQLAGVLQIPVNERKGLNFAKGLRSILRHDPDKILVGEIRDRETAEIAIQAALTGHLVFTTVHANNVFDVLSRFKHMGIDAYSFVTALNGVIAQRLIRLVCAHCARTVIPDEQWTFSSGLTAHELEGGHWIAAVGCDQCRGTGYQGRRALAEILILDDDLRQMILEHTPAKVLKEAARQRGFDSIRTLALNCARSGQTTLDEVNRITFAE